MYDYVSILLKAQAILCVFNIQHSFGPHISVFNINLKLDFFLQEGKSNFKFIVNTQLWDPKLCCVLNTHRIPVLTQRILHFDSIFWCRMSKIIYCNRSLVNDIENI